MNFAASISQSIWADETGLDVFLSVGPTVKLALLPQENSIFGIVTETYDLLRFSHVGTSKWIRGTVTLPIQHCLVVQRGKALRDVKKVLSHEQVRATHRSSCFSCGFRGHSHTTYRPWDSVNSSSQSICLRRNSLAWPPRLQLPKSFRSSRMLQPIVRRSARKFVFNCSPTWNYCTRVFRTSTVSRLHDVSTSTDVSCLNR